MPKDNAIILKKSDYSESSLLVQWLTKSHGIIHTVVKGARRSKSTFNGRIDLFIHGEIEYVESKKSELHTLIDIDVSLHPTIGSNYPKVVLASYFCALINRTCERESSVPEIYLLLSNALTWLESGIQPTQKNVAQFEKRLAKELHLTHKNFEAHILLSELGNGLPSTRQQAMDILPPSDSAKPDPTSGSTNTPDGEVDSLRTDNSDN